MVHVIPASNSSKSWTDALADAIEEAADGDTIQCRSEAMKELGIDAQSRMCPDKKLTYTVVEPTFDDWPL